MKFVKMILPVVMLLYTASTTAQTEPERLDLPGDNLNLYAVMKLFQESPTLEGFERKLNDPSSKINNLDLNADNKVDYIRVVDHPEGAVHNISLKVAINSKEEQDVAVFIVQKLADDKVEIQLIGDEELYGKDYIIEPNMNDNAVAAGETPNPGYSNNVILANGEPVAVQQTTTGQIATWPLVMFIYVPTYTVWNSPWYWDYYPGYWQAWEPFYWHYYYGYHFHWEHYYYGHYHHCSRYRVAGWMDHYYGSHYRSVSPFVKERKKQGGYIHTYSRPQLAVAGSERFRTDHPTSPYVKTRLPTFDHVGAPVRKPQIVKPGTVTPGEAPVKPVKPVRQQPATLPVKPETVTPIKEEPVKPVKQLPTRPPIRQEPITPGKSEPVIPPRTKPIIPERQETPNPVRERPVKQEPTRPVVRPVTPNKTPVTRPVITKPLRPGRGAAAKKKEENN